MKVGASTEQDYRKLQSIFCNHAIDFEFCSTAVRIIHENETCFHFNKEQLQTLQLDTNPVALMPATGSYRKLKNKKVNAGTVTQRVLLARNCKVMLRTKLSLEHKLANGSTGIVLEIIYYDENCPPMLPNFVLVEFNDYNGPTIPGTNLVPVKPIRCESDNKDVNHMLNVPLALAFAQTIYKSQGKTLARAFVNIG